MQEQLQDYKAICLLASGIHFCFWVSQVSQPRRTVTVWYSAPYKYSYLLTYLLLSRNI